MKRALVNVTVLVGLEVLLGAIFSMLTRAEGLVTPHGSPNLDAILVGIAYLTLRLIVHLALPAIVVSALAPPAVAYARRLWASARGLTGAR
jgi:hypothetical protein